MNDPQQHLEDHAALAVTAGDARLVGLELKGEVVPLEPWGYLSAQLQLDISLMGAVVGGLFLLRAFGAQLAHGRALGRLAMAAGTACFDTARAMTRKRPQTSPDGTAATHDQDQHQDQQREQAGADDAARSPPAVMTGTPTSPGSA